MNPQLSIKLARTTDPATSHEAAQELVTSGALGVQQRDAMKRVRNFPGRTSSELAGGDVRIRYQLARRLPELARMGKVTKGPARTCRVTGRSSITWRPA